MCGCGEDVLFEFLLHVLCSCGGVSWKKLWIGEVGGCSVDLNLGL